MVDYINPFENHVGIQGLQREHHWNTGFLPDIWVPSGYNDLTGGILPNMGGFRFVIGVPPVIIHCRLGFSMIFPNTNHPAIGDPPFMETPILPFISA